MKKGNKRETVIYTKDITESRLNEFKKQYEKIPQNWLRRFKKDDWQLAFTTDITISGNTNSNTFLVSDPNERRVWINVKIGSISDFPVYRAFLFYMQTEYGNPAENSLFEKICNEEKDKLAKLLGGDLIGVLPKEIFELLFIQMLEMPEGLPYSTLKTCKYVKSWINEDVFKVRTSILPDYLQIGTDITEYQIFEILKAWDIVPIGLREKFLNAGWKVLLTNSREWRIDERGRRVAGYITSKEERILVKASQGKLDMILYHEFGHFMYSLSNDKYLIREFYDAYLQEKKEYLRLFNDEYGVSNVEEYFAQVFAHYLKNPKETERCIKRSFDIIDAIAQKFK